MIADFLDSQPVSEYTGDAWLFPRVQVGGHAQVTVQGGLRMCPDAKEVYLPADFLTPLAIVMRCKRERREGLGRLPASSSA